MDNRFSKQFHAIFGIFMVCFYLGIGIFLLFFADRYFVIDKALRGIVGVPFILYGLYRIYRTYIQLVEAFSPEKEEDE